jgi:hypothetical protein
MFSCDGKYQTLWQNTRSQVYDTYNIPIGRFPVSYEAEKEFLIQFVKDYSKNVTEGEKFPDPIKVRVITVDGETPL